MADQYQKFAKETYIVQYKEIIFLVDWKCKFDTEIYINR